MVGNVDATTPTPDELKASLVQCFYAANQCASYHFWYKYAQPALLESKVRDPSSMVRYMRNAVIEGTLGFCRKAHEFFKEQESRDWPDTLHAYRYEYPRTGPIFDRNELAAINKLVSHITVHWMRSGTFVWELYPFASKAMARWIDFFGYARDYYAGDLGASDYCNRCELSLRLVRKQMGRDVAAARDSASVDDGKVQLPFWLKPE